MGEIVIGADPGINNFGFAVYDVSSGNFIDSGVFGVLPDKKRRLHFSDDFTRRFHLLSQQIQKVLRCHKPALVVFEGFTFLRHARSSTMVGGSTVALVSQCVAWQIPVCTVVHEEINIWLGKKVKSKKERKTEIAKKILSLWPNHQWPKEGKKKPKIAQHALDAAALAIVGKEKEQMLKKTKIM